MPRKVVWDQLPFTEVRPGIFGATVHTPQLTVTCYRYAPGTSWEEHRHEQDQVTTVLEGALDFVVDGQPVHLEAGQTATLPGNVTHSAVTPPSGAVTLNVLTYRERLPDG